MDDPQNLAEDNRSRVDVHSEQEIRYWMEALGVNRQQLRTAIRAVGPLVADLRKYLNRE